jgi:hypothetical protein
MKRFLCICFILPSLFAFSQTQDRNTLAVITPKTFGYVNGMRLDSIDAAYGQIETRWETIAFDYGQLGGRKKMTVTDDKGAALTFARTSLTFLLNFFYFNGWELSQSYHDSSEKSEVFILKKRTRQKEM